MEIQILSDLHLESPKAYDLFEIPPIAPYLALLGDIGNIVLHKAEVLAFLLRQLRQFKAVLFVPGNHEAYHSSWERTLAVLSEFEARVQIDRSLGQFVVLDRRMYRPQGTSTTILGCSLFSNIPQESQMAVGMRLNDFYLIDDWAVADHNNAHRRDLAWLNEQVVTLEADRIIILTHWSPSSHPSVMDPKHTGSSITSGFSTDLSNEPCFASSKVAAWAFGHTHYNCDVKMERENGPLRLVANQRGYYSSQANGFDDKKVMRC